MSEPDVSVPVKKEHLEQIERISKLSGVPVKELVEKAIALYLEKNKPPKS